MKKTLLITGSTDGIGLEAAKLLASLGHHVLVHGRNPAKLERARGEVASQPGAGPVEAFEADLSSLAGAARLADEVLARHDRLDVLINNAGVFATADATTVDGLDVRFAVNTIAPFLLTKRLLPRLGSDGRVVNLSSAAQAHVDVDALAGPPRLSDGEAYAQSKLALTMWSRHLGHARGANDPVVIAVNPGSMLGTKMVRDAYGVAGADVRIGAEILRRAALDDAFAEASGEYFENDARRFASPHPDALDPEACGEVVRRIERVLADRL